MMTKDQQDTVTKVYRQFVDSDTQDRQWTTLDTYMEALSWLNERQVAIEAAVMVQLHASGQPRCTRDHPIEHCFVPTIIDAVVHVLNLFSETGNLHQKNRFILEYYLAISQDGFILY